MKRANCAKCLAIIATIVVVFTVVTAIITLDPPGLQRQRKLDARRVKDLTNISHSVNSYWERKKLLPSDLSTLENEPGLRTPFNDPETGIVYSYKIINDKSYQLCAVFSLDSSDESQEYYSSRKWSHGAGKQCFDLNTPKSDEKSSD